MGVFLSGGELMGYLHFGLHEFSSLPMLDLKKKKSLTKQRLETTEIII